MEGRERVEWNRLSHLLALLAEVNRDPKKSRHMKPSMFNPFTEHTQEIKRIREKCDMSVMRDAFMRNFGSGRNPRRD